MTRTNTPADASVGGAGWQDIADAPRDGTRCRVAHELDPSSFKEPRHLAPTTGVFRSGRWVINQGFVCTDGAFRLTPTHFLPPTPVAENVGGGA